MKVQVAITPTHKDLMELETCTLFVKDLVNKELASEISVDIKQLEDGTTRVMGSLNIIPQFLTPLIKSMLEETIREDSEDGRKLLVQSILDKLEI